MQAVSIINSPLTFSLTNSYQYVEKLRITIHLSLTEKLLRSKIVDHLDSGLQVRRLQSLDYLHEYWATGIFPVNTDFPNSREPYFRDNYRTLCAMAYILQRSGYEDLVNTVNKTNNNVYINDINGGPVITAIQNLGLTKKEAARIQPTYAPHTPTPLHEIIIPWLISLGLFILLEGSYYILAKWLRGDNTIFRIIAWALFTITAFTMTFALTSLSYNIFGFWT